MYPNPRYTGYMRGHLPNPHITVAILAFIFCVCGHAFMTAYLDYNTTQKKFELLQNQERFYKNQVKGLEQKKSVIGQAEIFLDNTEQYRLLRKNWDEFSVDLKDEPVSFSQLKTILFQVGTTDHYYFLPESLIIRLGGLKKTPEKKEEALSAGNDVAKTTPVSETASDAVISLKGIFLVQQGRQDE